MGHVMKKIKTFETRQIPNSQLLDCKTGIRRRKLKAHGAELIKVDVNAWLQ